MKRGKYVQGFPYRYHRRPRTTQERRRNADPWEKTFSRGRRRRLPNAYDDLVACHQWWKTFPCWKLYRRTQYRTRRWAEWSVARS